MTLKPRKELYRKAQDIMLGALLRLVENIQESENDGI